MRFALLSPMITVSVLCATAASAAEITLLDTVTGAPTPATVVAETTTNGGFTIRDIGGNPGPSTLNDATNETTEWTHDLQAGLPRPVVGVLSATLTLDVRTGGDFPASDALFLEGVRINNPFNSPGNFETFTAQLDLLALYGVDKLLQSLNNDGELFFGLGNDSTVSSATFSAVVQLAPVPVPAAGGLLAGSLALLGWGARRRRSGGQ